ncbi:MAG: Ig-like domain-containing protein [Gammaproteobacteria bacterium]|nr:Ig-like domain-containing protein [Gammaproteobacteria bacterium]
MKYQIIAILALTLVSGFTQAVGPAVQTINVDTMHFYSAGGVAAAIPDTGLGSYNDQVTGNVNSNGDGILTSGTVPFFFEPWTATQQMWDSTPGAGKVWAGTTAVGDYSFTYVLTENQVAVGLYFDWSVNTGIAVLQIFDCPNGTAGACIGVHNDSTDDLYVDPAFHAADHPDVPGSTMVNGPFPGQHATFSGTTLANIDATPVANDDVTSTTADLTKNIAVLANDIDFEDGVGMAPPLPTTTTVNAPATSTQGFALTVLSDGTIDYTPTGGYIGPDSFTYTVTDTFLNTSATATVNITVTAAPNAAPVALDPSLNTDEDTPLVIVMTSLATDADVTDTLTFSNFDAGTLQGGSVTVNVANNELTYTPPTNYDGVDDTFTYQVTDTIDSSSVGTVTISINPVNDDPVCADVNLETDTDVPLTISEATDLIATCSDIEGDTLVVTGTTNPVVTGSTLASDGAGTLTYTPFAGYIGDDSFDFTVSDGGTGPVTATANVTVGVLYGNFTMLTASGESFGGTNDVIFTWDYSTLNVDENDTDFSIMTIESKGPEPFLGVPWYAHHVRVFGEGTYTFETDNAICTTAVLESTGCPGTGGPSEMTLVVGPGQYGAHILFDYSGSVDIDVVNLWDVDGVWIDPDGTASIVNDLYVGPAGTAPDPLTTWALVSRDVNGDGFNGSPMIDGPFVGFSANFSDGPTGSGAALPDITSTVSDTQLGNGAMGLVSLLGLLPVIAFFRRRVRH